MLLYAHGWSIDAVAARSAVATTLTALVMLASIYGVSKLVGRIYAAALVCGGARLSWGAALRLREI
jgi:hypothetical protein